MSDEQPNKRVEAQFLALSKANLSPRDQTDWIDLALACLDQAGLTKTAQDKIMYLLDQIGVWYTPPPGPR